VGIEPGDVGAGPGPERNLIDRGEKGLGDAFIAHHLRHRAGESGEMIDKRGLPDVKVIGIAEVRQLPDNLHLMLLRRAHHRQKAAPVVAVWLFFNQIPARAVARRLQALRRQRGVILLQQHIVAAADHHVEPLARRAAGGRAGKAALKKGVKQLGMVALKPG